MPVTASNIRSLNEDWEHVDDSTINEFLADALLIAADRFAGTTYSTAHQDMLTKWLSAHLLAMRSGENRLRRDKLDNLEQEYADTLGKGLEATVWGQQVKTLDTLGVLSNLGYRKAELRTIVSS